ncbi:MAG: hypothetical protein ACK4I8_02980 [Armatimonadota bacterium]
MKRHYKGILFWGFVDGIGWHVRRRDLERIVDAFDDVFTFSESELLRFRQRLQEIFNKVSVR